MKLVITRAPPSTMMLSTDRVGQPPHQLRQIDATVGSGRAGHRLGPRLVQGRQPIRRGLRAVNEPGASVPALDQTGAHRRAQVGVEHHGLGAAPARLLDREPGIIGEQRPNPDQDRVAQRANGVGELHRLRPAEAHALPPASGDASVHTLCIAQDDEGASDGSAETMRPGQVGSQPIDAVDALRIPGGRGRR